MIDKVTYFADNCKKTEDNDGNTIYSKFGLLHRIDGPAIEYCDGYKSWYLNGKRIPVSSQKGFERYMKLKAFL